MYGASDASPLLMPAPRSRHPDSRASLVAKLGHTERQLPVAHFVQQKPDYAA